MYEPHPLPPNGCVTLTRPLYPVRTTPSSSERMCHSHTTTLPFSDPFAASSIAHISVAMTVAMSWRESGLYGCSA